MHVVIAWLPSFLLDDIQEDLNKPALNMPVLCLFEQMWVFDEDVGMNQREITYVPGLYKIFDEILGECFILVI